MNPLPIQAWIALGVIGLFFFARRGRARKVEALERAGLLPRDGEATMEHVLALVRAREMLEAIKLYRTIKGCGLKEAKEAVEKLRDSPD